MLRLAHVLSLSISLVAAASACDSDETSVPADAQPSPDVDAVVPDGTPPGVPDAAEPDTPDAGPEVPEEPDVPAGQPEHVTTVASWLTGEFSSRAQSQQSFTYFDVFLYTVRVWPEREDGYWMYVQQSRDDDGDGAYEPPYRQRVYRVHETTPGEVTSTIYRIQGEAAFVDPWLRPGALDSLQESALTLAAGCDVRLVPQGDTFIGGTQGTDCTLSFGGYATSSVTLYEDRLESLDLLWDDNGNIINGLTPNTPPYRFDKLKDLPL